MKLVNVYKNIWLADITGTMSVFINKKIEDTMNAYIEKKFDPVTVGVLTVCEDNVFEKPKKEFGTGMEVVSSQSIHIRAGLNDGPPDHNAPYGDPNDVRDISELLNH